MEIFNEKEIELFSLLARLTQPMLLKSMTLFLESHYGAKKVVSTPRYIYAKGNIPICLLAHLDTVFYQPPKNIYFDRQQDAMWSPEGLGADDRAGVFAIVSIIKDGYLPHIVFTTDEERGCIGATQLAMKKNPFSKLKYLIQIDRCGATDCVFYDCENLEFQKYIESFGFITKEGTFTDISIICPEWRIAGVNLSSGYYDEHSVGEHLKTKELKETIAKVKLMLEDCYQSPTFKYIPKPRMFSLTKDTFPPGHFSRIKRTCGKCHKLDYDEFMLPVRIDKIHQKFYCGNCLSTEVNWCSNCGEPYDIPGEVAHGGILGLCPKCSTVQEVTE